MDTGMGKRTAARLTLHLVWLAMGLLPEGAIAEQAHVRSNAFDVVHYEMTVYADPGAQKLSATVSIDIQRALAASSDSLDFLLDRPYEVASVHREDGTPIPFERVVDGEPISGLHPGRVVDRCDWAFLRIPSSLFTSGDRQRIVVEYEGEKAIGMIGKEMFQMHTDTARWYPYRYDDLATATCTIVAPDSMTAMFGGKRIAVKEEEGGRVRSEFRTEFPLNFFPLFVGAWEETHSTDGNIELVFLHKAEHAEDADTFLRRTAQYLRNLRDPSMLGPYPYSQLVLIEFPHGSADGIAMPGGIVAYTFDRSGLEDWLRKAGEIFAHEIAHLWWGAGVFTVHDKDRTFLNEAFATYSAALFTELALGTNRMTEGFINRQVRNCASLLKDHNLLYSARLNYGKGAYVVHLLRRVMGDDLFFRTIRKYLSDHVGRMVNLDVFREACEAEYGKDLSWFFDQWVRRPGLPDLQLRYHIEHPQEGQSKIVVSIAQKGELYDLPVTLSFRAKAKGEDWENPVRQTKSVWIHDKHEEWTFHFDEDINKVSMNEDGWILTWDRLKTLPLSYSPSKKNIITRNLPNIVMMALMAVLGYFIARRRAQRKVLTRTSTANSG
jgi:hypothetical protein